MSSSRRSFLKQAAASTLALSFPSVLPSSVRGDNAPSRRVTLGAIGVGNRGYGNNLHNFSRLPGVQYLAVADAYRDRRDRFAAEINAQAGSTVCTAYPDFRDLLAREDIDGVVISSQDHWHVPMAKLAAAAGKDMYVEKPLGIAPTQFASLRRLVKINNIVFQYGTQQRSGKAARTAIDLIRNGYVGEIQRVDVWSPNLGKSAPRYCPEQPIPDVLDYDRWIGPAPMKPYCDVRCSNLGSYHCYDYSIGFIAGWGAHPLDILQWGLNTDETGPIAYGGTGYTEPDGDLFNTTRTWDVRFSYANGLPVRFMSADVAKPVVQEYHSAFQDNGTTFHGTEGWVSYSRGACYLSRNGKLENASLITFAEDAERAYVSDSHAGNFVDCIRSREPTINPLESAIRSDTISHLSDIAVRTGRALQWDPEKELILGDDEASALLSRPMRGA